MERAGPGAGRSRSSGGGLRPQGIRPERQPGRGYDYDYDTLADDLAGVMKELALDDVTLVGFSMGGGEVARYVTRHGVDRLRSVVLEGAPHGCNVSHADAFNRALLAFLAR